MIEIPNVVLFPIKEEQLVETKIVTREELSKLTPESIGAIPIQLRVGAVNYQIGVINKVRIGANAVTGDLLLQLKAKTILSYVDGEVKPIAYRFFVED